MIFTNLFHIFNNTYKILPTSHWIHLCSVPKTKFWQVLLPIVQWPRTIISIRSSSCHHHRHCRRGLCTNYSCPLCAIPLLNPSHLIAPLMTPNMVARKGQHCHEHHHRQLYTCYSCPLCRNRHLSLPLLNPTLSTMPNLVIREKATSTRIPRRNCPLLVIKRCPQNNAKCVFYYLLRWKSSN